mmetsp:Transcript_54509/g.122633  ORF Transcript_54509/g.122633 Transcript_54509/m.122633 type:complete len:355 (-) Transcript_54509:104-1168(-)
MGLSWRGLFANTVLAVGWVAGAVLSLGLPVGMAWGSKGISLLALGVVAIRNEQLKRLLISTVLVVTGLFGPAGPGFLYWLFWGCWGLLTVASLPTWIAPHVFRPWAPFQRAMQHGSSFYESCEIDSESAGPVDKEGSFFAFHPHGILSVGFGINGMWSKPFQEVAGRDCGFYIDPVLREDNPFMKLFCDWHGNVKSLTKETIQASMRERQNIALIPGGMEDATIMEHGRHNTAIAKRTGFIYYCLQHGYKLHPCYTFGEADSYFTWTGCRRLRLLLNRKGVPTVVFWGWRWFPLLPRQEVKYTTVVGPAVELPKIEKPTPEEVAQWHGVYCVALQKLFESKRESLGVTAPLYIE